MNERKTLEEIRSEIMEGFDTSGLITFESNAKETYEIYKLCLENWREWQEDIENPLTLEDFECYIEDLKEREEQKNL